MEDKTPMYILALVGIVAVVAVVYMLTGSSSAEVASNGDFNGITGNVIAEETEIAPIIGIGVIAKVLLAALLGGAVLHMYHKW